ncbi:MAG TPA: serpin family protein [Gemmatimonadaceae bacterium]|nr:serpin family protein [Gemmatimonadaceae bacterium]
MTLSRRILLIAAWMAAVACSDASGPKPPPSFTLNPAEQGVATSGNDFSFALFQQVAKTDPGSNVFISPLSASMSLGMAMNGASGSTFDAMRTALRFGSGDVSQLDAGYQGLIGLLRGLDLTTTFQIANSVWYRNAFAFKQPFLDTTKKYFDAQVQGLNFDDVPGSLATINGWVSSHTAGKIPTILDDIKPDEVMFLINAIYFKGTWQYQFDPKSTAPSAFWASDGTMQTVPFMNRPEDMKPEFRVGSAQGLAIAEMPYGNGAFAMDIVLVPFNVKAGIDSVAAQLNASTWAALIASLTDTDEAFAMPKFTLAYDRMLTNDLSTLGMGIAFSDAANFSGMSTQALKLSFVKQKAFVTVDETGTTAGASTVTGVQLTALREFRVDHPFIFVIRERQTGTILFMGKMLKIPA